MTLLLKPNPVGRLAVSLAAPANRCAYTWKVEAASGGLPAGFLAGPAGSPGAQTISTRKAVLRARCPELPLNTLHPVGAALSPRGKSLWPRFWSLQ
jgi:hypothetical protein